MNKYISVIAVLVVAGCAGGGSGPDGRFQVSSASRYVQATEAAAESNKELTGMNSEIVICDGACPSHLRTIGTPSRARSSSVQQGGVNLTVYDLSDVKFDFAEEGFGDTFTFVVDSDKKIVAIDMNIPEDEINTDNVDGYTADYNITKKNGKIYFNRNDDNTFSGFFNDNRYAENENNNQENNNQVNNNQENNNEQEIDGSNWELAKYTYASKGGDMGLKYSDFGNIGIHENKNTTNTDDSRLVFIGGYDDAKKLDSVNQDITQSDKFEGFATGNVTAIKNGEGSGKSLNIDGAAQLTFDKTTKETTISAQFGNWYDVVYTEDADTKKIELSNYQGSDDFKMLTAENDGTVTITDTGIDSDIRYFGDNDKPSEAVGLIQVRDCNGAECTNDYGTADDPNKEVRMNIGFGVKDN